MRRLMVTSAVAAAVLMSLAACGDDEVITGPSYNGCGLISRSVAAAATGAEITRTEEKSSQDSPVATFVGCRYLTEQAGAPALVVDVRPADNQSKAEGDIAATRSSCTTAQSLDVQGVTGFVCETGDLAGGPQAYATWDGYVVHAALTTAKESPEFPASVDSLADVIRAAYDNVSDATFTAS